MLRIHELYSQRIKFVKISLVTECRLPAVKLRTTVCVYTLTLQLHVYERPFTLDMSYILMRKAVACELGGSVVEVDCVVDLNRALRMVWGSTSGVGCEEAR